MSDGQKRNPVAAGVGAGLENVNASLALDPRATITAAHAPQADRLIEAAVADVAASLKRVAAQRRSCHGGTTIHEKARIIISSEAHANLDITKDLHRGGGVQ